MFFNADGVISLFKQGWPTSKTLCTNEKVTVSHQIWILATHYTKMNPGKTHASEETGAINQHLRPLGDSVYQTWRSRNSKRVWMGLTDNWQMAKILTDNWQIGENLTDNWHL